VTSTPAPYQSRLGRSLLAPVPLHRNEALCLYADGAPSSSTWNIYDVAGERVASLGFGSQAGGCWNSGSLAPGVYFIRLHFMMMDGATENRWQKIAVIP
jgi:hypothetical protein